MNEIKFIIFAIGMIIGIVLGEHKTCTELGGLYSWDYGTCKLEKGE